MAATVQRIAIGETEDAVKGGKEDVPKVSENTALSERDREDVVPLSAEAVLENDVGELERGRLEVLDWSPRAGTGPEEVLPPPLHRSDENTGDKYLNLPKGKSARRNDDDEVSLHQSEAAFLGVEKEDFLGFYNAEESANWFSRLFFGWTWKLVAFGFRNTVSVEDVYDLSEHDRAEAHASALFECLEAEERKFELRLKASLPNLQRQSDLLLLAPVKGSEEEDTEAKREQRRRMQIEFVDRYLIKYFLSRYRGPVIRSGVLRLVNDLFMFIPSLFIAFIIAMINCAPFVGLTLKSYSFVPGPNVTDETIPSQLAGCEAASMNGGNTVAWPWWLGYAVCCCLFFVQIIRALCDAHSHQIMLHVGLQVRGALVAAVYARALRLRSSTARRSTVGEVLNLMQLDSERMMNFCISFHLGWSCVFQIFLALVLLFCFIGWSTILGLVVICICIPLAKIWTHRLSNARRGVAKATDIRVRLINEILHGIRIVKYLGFERTFAERVRVNRAEELEKIRKFSFTRATLYFILFVSPTIVTIVTFVGFILIGDFYSFFPLTAELDRIFVGLSLFKQLSVPLSVYPLILGVWSDGFVSARRLEVFLVSGHVISEQYAAESTSHDGNSKSATSSAAPTPKGPMRRKDSILDRRRRKSQVTPGPSEPVSEGETVDVKRRHRARSLSQPSIHARRPSTNAQLSATKLSLAEEERHLGEGKDNNNVVIKVSSVDEGTTDSDILFPIKQMAEKECKQRKEIAVDFNTQRRLCEPGAVELRAASFSWEPTDSTPSLQDLTFYLPKGSLTMVIGPMGSGKSSLLSALLGEMFCVGGGYVENVRPGEADTKEQLHDLGSSKGLRWGTRSRSLHGNLSRRVGFVGGKIAYMGQQPWVRNCTFQQNVTRTNPFDIERYTEVVNACGLEVDAAMLHAGHETEIVDSGSNLSGGQLQRLALAATTYEDADVYMFDEPLSALDPEVAEEVMLQCVDGLLRERAATRILATNQLHFLPFADKIIVMDRGKISRIGTYEAIQEQVLGETDMKSNQKDFDGIMSDIFKRKLRRQISMSRRSTTSGDGRESNTHMKNNVASIGLDREQVLLMRSQRFGLQFSSGLAMSRRAFGSVRGISTLLPVTDEAEPENLSMTQDRPMLLATMGRRAAGGGIGSTVMKTPTRLSPTKVAPSPAQKGNGEEPKSTPNMKGTPKELQLRKLRKASLTNIPEGLTARRAQRQRQTSVSPILSDSIIRRGKVSSDESLGTGAIRFGVYKRYFSSMRHKSVMVLVGFLLIFAQTNAILNDWWLTTWPKDTFNISRLTNSYDFVYSGIYLFLGIMLSLSTFLRAVCINFLALRSSRHLHRTLLHRILRAKTAFFEQTPKARILARLARDISVVDELVAANWNLLVSTSSTMLGSIVLIVILSPMMAFVLVPLGLVFYGIQYFYRKAAVELRRIDAATRSPLYAHFSETIIGGLMVIRAGRKQPFFINEAMDYIDNNSRCVYSLRSVERWLGMNLDSLGGFLVSAVAVIGLVLRDFGMLTEASMLGLVLTYSLQATTMMSSVVRSRMDTETSMHSVERIVDYIDHVPLEADRAGEDPIKKLRRDSLLAMMGANSIRTLGKKRPSSDKLETTTPTRHSRTRALLKFGVSRIDPLDPPLNWPAKGEIQFEGYSLRYPTRMTATLKFLSFSINSFEKVGIVGRTGAGKSSLVQALFRMIEAETGRILIDGWDISKVSLSRLRRNINIIPQDPILFSGTIRDNLDPYEVYSDQRVWRALDRAGATGIVKSYPEQLNAKVDEFGENLSSGQRQLLCLARSLLRKTSILIMDEATSSIDAHSDDVVQETVKREFSDCTVLTIAHSLSTIISCDRVLVFEKGEIIENDKPSNLLKNTNGKFAQLLLDVGITTPEMLEETLTKRRQQRLANRKSFDMEARRFFREKESIHLEKELSVLNF